MCGRSLESIYVRNQRHKFYGKRPKLMYHLYIYTFLYMDVECIKCINVELAAIQFIAKTRFGLL
jgi:hypothetical protein